MIKKPIEISIYSEFITLGQFLKLAGIIQTGGEAKQFLAEHEIIIDGEVDCRRGRKLKGGEIIEVLGQKYEITR